MSERGHGMWVAGLATTAVGTGMAVSMSIRLILDATDGRNVSRLAMGLWATGVAVATTGAVLWGLGHRKRRRASLGLAPTRGWGMAATLGGRF
jgi:hypothetical protein